VSGRYPTLASRVTLAVDHGPGAAVIQTVKLSRL
jgi:hypothetical protein